MWDIGRSASSYLKCGLRAWHEPQCGSGSAGDEKKPRDISLIKKDDFTGSNSEKKHSIRQEGGGAGKPREKIQEMRGIEGRGVLEKKKSPNCNPRAMCLATGRHSMVR